jgi:hypothetical protein
MRRLLLTVGLLGLCGALTGPAQAGWTEFWLGVNVDCHRMKCWPKPFVYADRQSVRTPLMLMADNGWRLQNTLGDDFFETETQQLTRAGQLKVQSILRDSPLHRRAVYVLRGENAETSAIRLDSVQRSVAGMVQEGELPPVSLTDSVPRGGSGDYYDQVDRSYRSSMPTPRLPEMAGEGEQ